MLLRLIAVLALGLATGGCAALGQLSALTAQIEEVTEPGDLYILSPKTIFEPTLPEVQQQIVIEEPIAASYLNTDRIAIKPSPFQVEYFPESRWADRAPLLVQRLLVESFENTGKIRSVSAQRIGLASDFLLFTDLREFQAETTPAPDDPVLVDVQLNLKLVEERGGIIIASEDFSHEVLAISEDPLAVVAAFDEALGEVLKDAVEWTIREVAGWTRAEEPELVDAY